MNTFKAYFFDMDGTLLDSLPNHVKAWQSVLPQYGIPFEPRDCYMNEGRTSKEVIRQLIKRAGKEFEQDQIDEIYHRKTQAYRNFGGGLPMRGVKQVLDYLTAQGAAIWVVTGGGQTDLYEQLEGFFPGVFSRERMITAFDVKIGKPDPEPYLIAWQRCGFRKEECCIIENAPLGVRAGHAAGLFTIAVNTGPLDEDDLRCEGADLVFPDMPALLEWLQTN